MFLGLVEGPKQLVRNPTPQAEFSTPADPAEQKNQFFPVCVGWREAPPVQEPGKPRALGSACPTLRYKQTCELTQDPETSRQCPTIKKSLVFQTKRYPMAPMASHVHSKKKERKIPVLGVVLKPLYDFFPTSFASV